MDGALTPLSLSLLSPFPQRESVQRAGSVGGGRARRRHRDPDQRRGYARPLTFTHTPPTLTSLCVLPERGCYGNSSHGDISSSSCTLLPPFFPSPLPVLLPLLSPSELIEKGRFLMLLSDWWSGGRNKAAETAD